MTDLTHSFLPGNDCFGCGPMNPHGLQITVRTDPDDATRILGTFSPAEHMTGFPGITHGGMIYTALDCMASWCGMVVKKTKAIWILRSATMKYHRPAFQGMTLELTASITQQTDDPWHAITVHTEARDAKGKLLAEGDFKSIPLAQQKFLELTGMRTLPANWQAWFDKP